MPQTDHRARGGISPRRQCPRLALILLELSENFGVPDGRGLRLTLPARHRILSELVGASRSRVTEHLSMFERKHLISPDNRQLVANRDRSESFLAQTHISADGDQFRKAATRQFCLNEYLATFTMYRLLCCCLFRFSRAQGICHTGDIALLLSAPTEYGCFFE